MSNIEACAGGKSTCFLAAGILTPVEYPQPPDRSGSRLWETGSMKPRILRVTKWLTMTPAIAVCTRCQREFKVPLTVLARTKDAQDYLQQSFDRHVCEPPDAHENSTS
jgi:hypothetical protein